MQEPVHAVFVIPASCRPLQPLVGIDSEIGFPIIRQELMEKLNQKAGTEVIRDIVLK